VVEPLDHLIRRSRCLYLADLAPLERERCAKPCSSTAVTAFCTNRTGVGARRCAAFNARRPDGSHALSLTGLLLVAENLATPGGTPAHESICLALVKQAVRFNEFRRLRGSRR